MLEYDDHPGFIRLLAIVGGTAMVIGPLLKWAIAPELLPSESAVQRGIESVEGWVAVLCGLATIAFGIRVRLVPLAIVTGLIGGALASRSLLNYLSVVYVIPYTEITERPNLGLILSMSGAALAGAAGVAGLLVASAVRAVESRL